METLWILEKPRQYPCLPPSLHSYSQSSAVSSTSKYLRGSLPKDHILHPSQGASAQTVKFIIWETPASPHSLLLHSPFSTHTALLLIWNSDLLPGASHHTQKFSQCLPRASALSPSLVPGGRELLQASHLLWPLLKTLLLDFVRLCSHYVEDTQCILWPPSLPSPLSLVPGLFYILSPLITVNLSSIAHTKR